MENVLDTGRKYSVRLVGGNQMPTDFSAVGKHSHFHVLSLRGVRIVRKAANAIKASWLWIVAMGVYVAFVLSYLVPYWYPLKTGVAFGEALYSAAGAAIVTILAISFSFSLFTVQYAAAKYMPGMLDYYVKESKTWFVFSFFAIAAIFNFVGLSGLLPAHAWLSSLVLLVGCMYYLALNFIHSSNMVSPLALLHKLKIKTLRVVASLPENDPKIEAAMSQVFYLVRGASEIRDQETYTNGMDAITEIYHAYFQAKGNFLSGTRFLDVGLEKLNSMGELAVSNRDTFFLQVLFEKLGIIGVDACRSTSVLDVNPYYSMLAGHYLEQLGMTSLASYLYDASAGAIRNIEKIGLESIRLHRDDGLAVQQITAIGRQALTMKDWYVPSVAASSLANLLALSASAQVRSIDFETDLKEIQRFATQALVAGFGVRALLSLYGPQSIFKQSLVNIARSFLTVKNSEYPMIETHPREKDVKELETALIDHLGRIAHVAFTTQDWLILKEVTTSLSEIGRLCVPEKFKTYPDHFADELKTIVNELSSLFISVKGLRPDFSDDLIYAIEILCFESLRNGINTVVPHALSNLKDMAEEASLRYNKREFEEICKAMIQVSVYTFALDQKELTSQCITTLTETAGAQLRELANSVIVDYETTGVETVQELRNEAQLIFRKGVTIELLEQFPKLIH